MLALLDDVSVASGLTLTYGWRFPDLSEICGRNAAPTISGTHDGNG
jgi:hypothetical protein